MRHFVQSVDGHFAIIVCGSLCAKFNEKCFREDRLMLMHIPWRGNLQDNSVYKGALDSTRHLKQSHHSHFDVVDNEYRSSHCQLAAMHIVQSMRLEPAHRVFHFHEHRQYFTYERSFVRFGYAEIPKEMIVVRQKRSPKRSLQMPRDLMRIRPLFWRRRCELFAEHATHLQLQGQFTSRVI